MFIWWITPSWHLLLFGQVIKNTEGIMRELGRHLAALRKKHNFRQTDLAKKLDVSQQVISNIERGQTAPDIELLQKMADIYGISLDQLVGRDFVDAGGDDFEKRMIAYLNQMDEKGKELSLGLVSQVAQHQGSDNGGE